MKKNLFVPAAILLLAFSATSCKKEALVTGSSIAGEAAGSPAAIVSKSSGERTPTPLVLEKYSWKVGNISVNGINLTPSYCEYGFKFNSNNSVIATKESATVNGSWSLNNSNSLMAMLFDQNEKLSLADLNGNWEIVRVTSRSIYMQINDQAFQAELRFDIDPFGVK